MIAQPTNSNHGQDRQRALADGAGVVGPLMDALAPNLGIRIEAWDGTSTGPPVGPTARVRSADALRRLLWAPGELGLGRAYVAGEIDIEGDIFDAVRALRPSDRSFGSAREKSPRSSPPRDAPASASRRLPRRRRKRARGGDAIRSDATLMSSATTTTSVTTSTGSSSARP